MQLTQATPDGVALLFNIGFNTEYIFTSEY